MKKLLSVTCLLLLTALSSFSTTRHHSFFSSPSAKKFSCPAATLLTASKNVTVITLAWSSTAPAGASFTPGGTYNYIVSGSPQNVPFHAGPTTSHSATISVPSNTYSLTYQVTTTCLDGTTSTSSAATFNF